MKWRRLSLLLVLFSAATACSATEEPEATSADTATPDDSGPSAMDTREFSTDFATRSISFADVLSGGPGKDGIPALDAPSFSTQRDASAWLEEREPVLVAQWPQNQADAEARIYPLQILMWHEIVNDRIAGDPIIVTYCPLCNTGVGFVGRVGDQELDFGVTGRLRFSNLLMYDRQTESWWQQASGDAVVGELTGKRLQLVPLLLMSFRDAQREYPDAMVLNRKTGVSRPYGTNPYRNYDSSEAPFLYQGPAVDDSAEMLERVIAIELESESTAVTYSQLHSDAVVELDLAGTPVAVLWSSGTASALDSSSIAEGRDVGSANAFIARYRAADGSERSLSFEPVGEPGQRILFRDQQTGSLWSSSGRAMEGPLAGTRLQALPAVQHFWFSYNAFSQD